MGSRSRSEPRSPQARDAVAANAWTIELQLERTGFLYYVYRRLRLERNGRRAAVREFVLRLDYDTDLRLTTSRRKLVRQRGRALTAAECDQLWRRVLALDPWAARDAYPCLDHLDPERLDDAVGIDGVPLALSVGEEGPACLSVRPGKAGPVERTVIERYAPPPARPRGPRGRRAPLASLLALVDGGLAAAAPLTYRKTEPTPDLLAEIDALKALDFLNLRQFERRSIEALGRLASERALPYVTRGLFASDPDVRLCALDAIERIGAAAAAEDVELLYYADHLEVRERARDVLERLRANAPWAH